MRKIFTLLILLLLLPVTALAAAPSGQVLYVGGVQISNTGYWTTDSDGNVTPPTEGGTPSNTEGGTPSNNYIHYDAEDNILTLRNATIKNALDYGNNPPNSLISGAAIGVLNQNGAAKLTITLDGTNTIAEVGNGICVLAHNESTGNASLTIMGNGSLTASVSVNSGILVQSNGGNATLSIENAEVTTTSSSSYGVLVRAKDSSNASLTVNGGSLTATGKSEHGAGIQYTFGSRSSGSGEPSLTVSNSAIVRANGSAGGITNNSSTGVQYGTGGKETGGIIFNDKVGTVYGSVTLEENLTIGEGESLTIPQGASLDCNEKLTNNGTINVESGGKLEGTPTGSGTLKIAPTITTTTLPDGEVGTVYSQSLAANGDTPITWSLVSGSTLPDGLALNESTGEITGTPSAAGEFKFTVTATNDAGSDSKEVTLNVKSVPVTGVTLDKQTLELYTGDSQPLTATVQPANATNKNVTWSSDNETVATVNTNGNVTAVAAGTATITVTTEDGTFTATCKVTVTHSMVHTPKKDATCTADGNEPATGHHYVNGTCTVCGEKDPDYRPDPISYYNIYVEDVCDGVEVTTSKNVVREGGSISVYVEKDTANYTFDNFKVYYKRSYYGTWDELKEGTQPGEYPINNIWTHIYIKAQGAEEKEDPTGIESIEGVKVYTKDGSLYVQTPQREQVIIVSMSGAVVKNEEQVGLKQYHGLQPGIYIVRVGDRAYKLRLN